MENLEDVIRSYSINIVLFASFALLILTIVSLKIKKLSEGLKEILFFSIVTVVLFPTLYMAFSTIYLNSVSSSGGPVHWHADLEIWSCGRELDLVNPTGLSNKVGTATLHEHNDKRIHLEGVVVTPIDASLGKFFEVIGGEITPTILTVPTVQGVASYYSGQSCDNDKIATIQTFVYQVKDGKYTQIKVTNPQEYIIAPQQNVPAGDCIIIEFDEEKPMTDKLCRSFMVAEKIGKLQKGY